VVAEAPSARVSLHLPGRPAATDFRMLPQAAK